MDIGWQMVYTKYGCEQSILLFAKEVLPALKSRKESSVKHAAE